MRFCEARDTGRCWRRGRLLLVYVNPNIGPHRLCRRHAFGPWGWWEQFDPLGAGIRSRPVRQGERLRPVTAR